MMDTDSESHLAGSSVRGTFQFSLLGLLLTITAVGLLLGAVLFVARLAGVPHSQALMLVFGQQLFRFPLLVVWLVGGVVAVRRWKQHPNVSL